MCLRADKKVLAGGRVGFTLVEVLVVVAIMVLLVAGLVTVSSYLQTQNKVVLTEKCIELLSKAVEEFYDITGHYPVYKWTDIGAVGSRLAGASALGGTPNPDELLYLQLSLLPQTREIIAKLSDKLVKQPTSGATVRLAGQSSNTPYLRSIVDGWGNFLVYEEVSGGFPKIRSYGPDGANGGGDDIPKQ